MRLDLLHGHCMCILQCFMIITVACALQETIDWRLLARKGAQQQEKKMMAPPNLHMHCLMGVASSARKDLHDLLPLSSVLYNQEGSASSCTLQKESASADLVSIFAGSKVSDTSRAEYKTLQDDNFEQILLLYVHSLT